MVTYDKAHLLLRWHGGFGASVTAPLEHWTAGVRIDIGTNGAWSEAQKTAFLQTIKAASEAFHANTDVSAGTSASLTEMTAAYIDVDGHYLAGTAQDTTHLPTSPTFGAGQGTVSWDTAQAITLRTTESRGRGHVGRFYWPCTSAVATDGLWSTNKAQSTAAAAATLLNAVNQAARSIWSAASGVSVFSGLAPGVHYPVVRVEVGRAPDTQRRRTKQLQEQWLGTDLTTAQAARETRSQRSF